MESSSKQLEEKKERAEKVKKLKEDAIKEAEKNKKDYSKEPSGGSTMRESYIESAVEFLKNQRVLHAPLDDKKAFLKRKSLNDTEIQEAIRRSGINNDGVGQGVSSVISNSVSMDRREKDSWDKFERQPAQERRDKEQEDKEQQQERREKESQRREREWKILTDRQENINQEIGELLGPMIEYFKKNMEGSVLRVHRQSKALSAEEAAYSYFLGKVITRLHHASGSTGSESRPRSKELRALVRKQDQLNSDFENFTKNHISPIPHSAPQRFLDTMHRHPLIIDFALLSKASYLPKNRLLNYLENELPGCQLLDEAYVQLPKEQLAKSLLTLSHLADLSIWKMALVRDNARGKLIAIFRGSENPGDLLHSAKILFSREQYTRPLLTKMEKVMNEWTKKYGKISDATGHSAAGYWLTHILLNDADLTRITWNGFKCPRSVAGKDVMNFCTDGDPLLNLSVKGRYIVICTGGHGIDNFLSLRNCSDMKIFKQNDQFRSQEDRVGSCCLV